jgi:hypothetical protein
MPSGARLSAGAARHPTHEEETCFASYIAERITLLNEQLTGTAAFFLLLTTHAFTPARTADPV